MLGKIFIKCGDVSSIKLLYVYYLNNICCRTSNYRKRKIKIKIFLCIPFGLIEIVMICKARVDHAVAKVRQQIIHNKSTGHE